MECFWQEWLHPSNADDRLLWAERYAMQVASAECFDWKDVDRVAEYQPEEDRVVLRWYVDDSVVDE